MMVGSEVLETTKLLNFEENRGAKFVHAFFVISCNNLLLKSYSEKECFEF